MEAFLSSLVAVLGHPVSTVGAFLMAGLWFYALSRLRRVNKIREHMRSLPVVKRRYTLEREYKIYPGTGNKPLAFLAGRRRRYWMIAGAGTLILTLGFLGAVAFETNALSPVNISLDDSSIQPERYGYLWRVRLKGAAPEAILLRNLKFRVLRKTEHPEKDHEWPSYGPSPTGGRRLITLKPDVEEVMITRPGEEISMRPGEDGGVLVLVMANHRPNEGWIYDVQLEAEWQLPGYISVHEIVGKVYRIGWPGMPHWSERTTSDGGSIAPVADPVAKAEEGKTS